MPQLDQTTNLFHYIRRNGLLFAAVFMFSLLSFATNATRAQEDLSKLVDQAKHEFKPVTKGDVEDARDDLKDRMEDVERYVEPSTGNGKHWLHYLRWDQLEKAVDTEDQNTAYEATESVLRRLNRNEDGLENRRFRRLASALRRYHDLLEPGFRRDSAKYYGAVVEGLRREFEDYRKAASAPPRDIFELYRAKQALGNEISFIENVGQAPELVTAIRREMDYPNAVVDLDDSLLSASAGKINRNEGITDCILGTNVHGNAHTRGNTDVVTVPSDDKAVVVFNSKGHSVSQNTGFNGPAVIGSTSYTDFTAKKRVELTDQAFVSGSAKANATTHLDIHSVSKNGGGLGSRLVSRIGWRRAQSSRGEAESISANHAEGRIQGQVNDELNDEVHKLRDRYVTEYRRPLERRDEVPDDIHFSSGRHSIRFETTQASHSPQLGAPTQPPEVREDYEVTMRLHESAVESYAASVLGGATARQRTPDEDVKFDVTMPKWMDDLWKKRKTEATSGDKEGFKEFSMTLQDNHPLSVRFLQDKVFLTLHIAQLNAGKDSFADWDVTGQYSPEVTSEGHVLLHRAGELDAFPAGFRGRYTSDREKTIGQRNNLVKEFNKRSAQGQGFPKTIEFEPVKPSGRLADAGPLEFRTFTPGDGWLTIGLDREGVRTR